MVSRLLRRSGVAVLQLAENLGWRPTLVVQVGVGHYHQEVDVMQEAWPGVHFVGFEPQSNIHQDEKMGYPGQLFRVALSDKVGRETLYVKTKHKDGSSLFPHTRPNERESYAAELVLVDTLDHFLSRCDDHTLLWLDCEGSELNVLRGGKEYVKGVEVINVETASNPPGDQWCSPVEIHRWMKENGFWRQWHHTYRDSAGQCDVVYVRKCLFNPKYCICPCEIERWQAGNESST